MTAWKQADGSIKKPRRILKAWGCCIALVALGPAGEIRAQANTEGSSPLAWSGQEAPAPWGGWAHRLPVELVRRDAATAGWLPVEFSFALPAERLAEPERELRLLRVEDRGWREVPFQLSGVVRWTGDTEGERSSPTVTGTVTFFDEGGGPGDARYLLLYGNPEADAPAYPAGVHIGGRPEERTFDTGPVRFHLHPSGQLGAVVLAGHAERPLTSSRGVVHWNPDIFVPARRWFRAWEWDGPEHTGMESGPVFAEFRRSGIVPGFPEVRLSVTYRFFAGRPYVFSATRISLLDDLGVVSLRNDQLVFDGGTFSRVAWGGDGRTEIRALSDLEPVNRHGDVLRLPADVPFVALFCPDARQGAASVRVRALNSGPAGAPARLHDHATYVADAGLQYWFRPLVYFHVGWSREHLIHVPAGSEYAEENLYLFFEPAPDTPLEVVERTLRAASRPPFVNLGTYPLPPDR